MYTLNRFFLTHSKFKVKEEKEEKLQQSQAHLNICRDKTTEVSRLSTWCLGRHLN